VTTAARRTPLAAAAALRFVISFGVVSLFADMTYEGMRSISGPYLALLGASGTAVGLIAGTGSDRYCGERIAHSRLGTVNAPTG
jgi:hypothetical protein